MDKKVKSLPNPPTYIKQDTIILNYGIEIECVFDIINELDVYISFIDFFFKKEYNIEKKIEVLDDNEEEFNSSLNELVNLIKKLEKGETEELIKNDIYINLDKIYSDNKNFYIYFKEKYTKILKFIKSQSESPNTKEEEYNEILIFITNFTQFIKDFITLISRYLNKNDEIDYYLKDYIYYILELFVIGDYYKELENRIKFINIVDNLKIYNENSSDLSDFYNISQQDDSTLHLYLTKDATVVCDDKIVYKNIISGNLSKYKYLFNNCEFITQVFKTPDEIQEKLKIFFNNSKIQSTILNCEKTSNHVHISFNKNEDTTVIIKPDIKIIITLICICYYFQDNIYKLFLNIRNNNIYCAKLNYNFNDDNKSKYDIIFNKDSYDNNIIKLCYLFYKKYDTDIYDYYEHGYIKNNRYFWLNIVNLFEIDDDYINIKSTRPPTVEFRIKHGSTDTNELVNVCKLYRNIINYAIELSDIISNDDNNLIDIYEKIENHINTHSPDSIYNIKILDDIKYYFTDPLSEYVIGLHNLNNLLIDDTTSEPQQKFYGGITRKTLVQQYITNILHPKYLLKKHLSTPKYLQKKILRKSIYNTGNKFLDKKLEYFNNKKIYKINSFGKQFIGYGLNNDIIKDLLLYLNTKNKFSKYSNEEKFKIFLKDYGLSYGIYNKKSYKKKQYSI